MKLTHIFAASTLGLLLAACSPTGDVASASTKSPIGLQRNWTTPHAGQLRSGPGMQAEGVPIPGSPGGFFVYFYNDKGEPIDMTGALGRAGFAAEKEAKGCELAFVGENALGCSVNLSNTPNLQAIVYVQIPGGQVAKINFDFLLASMPDTDAGRQETATVLQATDQHLKQLTGAPQTPQPAQPQTQSGQ